jgi:pimeloyl-ACP methyl ester carboxylesterase
MLMADADTALAEIGPSTVLGFGLGAYVALLLAGSRAELVRGAVLCAGAFRDGGGLAGGGPEPPEVGTLVARPAPGPNPDPQALAELSRDVRPPGYARLFVRQAAYRATIDRPITVASDIPRPRPPWLDAILEPAAALDRQGAVEGSVRAALDRYRLAAGT